MTLNVERLLQAAATLEQSLLALDKTPPSEEVMFDLYRKALKAFVGAPRSVDGLVFNDLLRHAGKHAIFDEAAVS